MTTRKPIIGIVGGIGAGKSAVAEAFASLGCLVISSDEANREILDRPEVAGQLRNWWGERVLGPDGRVNRKAVAEIVFADGTERRRLESLTHPLIAAHRAAMILAGLDDPAVVAIILDSPLLFESRLDTQCDRVVFVEASEAQRFERLRRSRGWDEAEFRRREASQLSVDAKRRRSGYVIRNESTMDDLRKAVADVLNRIRMELSP